MADDPVPMGDGRRGPVGAEDKAGAAEPTTSAAVPDGPDRRSHVTQRAVVFEHLRLLYVPVPKAGCTALLWALAGLARLPEDLFIGSMGREVSRPMTIHAIGRWPEAFQFRKRSREERERIFAEDGWLRFAVARHPFRRLWSAWQSKILLAEPQFVEKFSSEPWFPEPTSSAAEVLQAFRAFLDACQTDPSLVNADVHWAPQTGVIEYPQITYDHLGQVEKLEETLTLIREHVSENKAAQLPELPRANVAPLPYAHELFTDKDARFLEEVYADDMKVFDYAPPPDEPLSRAVPESWIARVDSAAAVLDEMRQRNQRIADIQSLLKQRRSDVFEMRRLKIRAEKLRREERQRNKRLQRRLRKRMKELERKQLELDDIHRSFTWRLMTPFRKVTAATRRLRRFLSE